MIISTRDERGIVIRQNDKFFYERNEARRRDLTKGYEVWYSNINGEALLNGSIRHGFSRLAGLFLLHQPALQEASSKIMCLSGRGGWLLL